MKQAKEGSRWVAGAGDRDGRRDALAEDERLLRAERDPGELDGRVRGDKDLDAILPLMPEDTTYIFTAPDTPRALPAEEILHRFTAFRAAHKEEADTPGTPTGVVTLSSRTYAFMSVRQAVQMALSLARGLSQQLSRSASAESPAPPLIYIGGSTFVVAEALPLFK